MVLIAYSLHFHSLDFKLSLTSDYVVKLSSVHFVLYICFHSVGADPQQ